MEKSFKNTKLLQSCLFGSLGYASQKLPKRSNVNYGCFQRAILQSCTALDPSWRPLTQETALIFSDLFSKAMGCDQNQVEVLKCLQNRDMADVMILSEVIEGTTKWMAVPDNDFTQGFIKHYLYKLGQTREVSSKKGQYDSFLPK